jgi:hypothetical protein
MSICSKSGAWRRNRSYSGVGAEAHDPLDAGPVVPGPVEDDDLAGAGRWAMYFWKYHCVFSRLARRRQRGDPDLPRVEHLR